MSFDRILSFLNELSQTVKVLFNESDNKVLPSALRKGIFTIFVDDNVDKNSSSVDATENFHGTGVTVMQFPTVETPGQQRQRKRFLELTSDERVQVCKSLAAFTTVLPIKGKVNATYAVETVSIPDAFREYLDTITHHELKKEDNWLEVACGDGLKVHQKHKVTKRRQHYLFPLSMKIVQKYTISF